MGCFLSFLGLAVGIGLAVVGFDKGNDWLGIAGIIIALIAFGIGAQQAEKREKGEQEEKRRQKEEEKRRQKEERERREEEERKRLVEEIKRWEEERRRRQEGERKREEERTRKEEEKRQKEAPLRPPAGVPWFSREWLEEEERRRREEEERRREEEERRKEEEERRKEEEERKQLQPFLEFVQREPQNPYTYLKLASFYLSKALSLAEREMGREGFEILEFDFYGKVEAYITEASSNYAKALAIGFDRARDSAFAHYILAFCLEVPWGKIIVSSESGLERCFIKYDFERDEKGKLYLKEETVFHLKEAEKEFLRHLKIYPEDEEVLEMLSCIYEILGKSDKKGKVLADLRKVRSRKELVRAGITELKPLVEAGKVGWRDFETQCLNLIKAMGFDAELTSPTADGGIDIIATSRQPLFRGKYIIQCKKWDNPVGEPVLRDLYGLVLSHGANKGIIITTSSFTDGALRFAEGKQLELIDGQTLAELIKKYLVKGEN